MDWNDPAQRARLAEQLGPEAYNLAFRAHLKSTTVAIVNGHRIRPVPTRFGTLFAVGNTNDAYPHLEQAKTAAADLPPGTDTDND